MATLRGPVVGLGRRWTWRSGTGARGGRVLGTPYTCRPGCWPLGTSNEKPASVGGAAGPRMLDVYRVGPVRTATRGWLWWLLSWFLA